MKKKILIFNLIFFFLKTPIFTNDLKTFTIMAVGDFVHPSNTEISHLFTNLGKEKYEYIRPIIMQSDLAFINLETPFTTEKPVLEKKYVFVSYPEELENILWAGFNLLSLSNNHMFDAGIAGIEETLSLLEKNTNHNNSRYPAVWAGAGITKEKTLETQYINIKNNKVIAFSAYGNNDKPRNINIYEVNKVVKDIKNMKKSDLIIISIHYGDEYEHVPNKKLRTEYRQLIDAGAHIIFGHHPHVVQGIEKYKNGIIFYSLGNFTMGTLHPDEYKENLFSMIAQIKLEINDSILTKMVEILPLYVDNKQPMTFEEQTYDLRQFIPRIPEEPFASEILKEIIERSKKIKNNNTNYKIENSRIIIKMQ
ncbi:MAG: CapA family protein [Spirochaetia bacterium]|nr:CapA family protein [Spirochaetia bacterium]